MHWADVLAEELLQTNTKHVLATGITPSGPIHIGNMREVLTTDAVYRALIKRDAEVEFIYIADDFDHLRKVYPHLPESYAQYVGQPISQIPCPCGKHSSYSDHYLELFLGSLDEIGIQPHVYRASSMYKDGVYSEAIQTALEHTDQIRQIIETISKRSLPKHWLPFNIKCSNCNRLTETKPLLYEYPYIEYQCSCGFEGRADVRKGGIGKLPWRVDWPARWKMLEVTFEPFGKDLGTTGGARQTGERIVEEIYKYPAPKYTVYEFILLKGKGAMHSSKGTALSSQEMLAMTPPEVLRFLIMKNQPNKHITFDPGFGLLSLVDEYDQLERAFFGKEEPIKGLKDLDVIYELSQPYEIPTTPPLQIPYRHLVTLVQIAETWENLLDILRRTNQITEKTSKKDLTHLQQRMHHVQYWLTHFAPKAVTFNVKKTMPTISLSAQQTHFLNGFLDRIDTINWAAEEIHNLVYDIIEAQKLSPNNAFASMYLVLLGQNKGPRIGYFLSNLDKSFVVQRFEKAIT